MIAIVCLTAPVSTDEGKGDGELGEGEGDMREPDMERYVINTFRKLTTIMHTNP